MNCPNCGSETLANQQYCRSCGADLVDGRPRLSLGQIRGLMTLAMAFGGIMIALAGKMLELSWLTFTGVFIAVGGMFLMAAFSMIRQPRPQRGGANIPKTLPTARPESEPERAGTTNKLLPIGENDFLPSVIENTTELLTTPASRRPDTND